MCSNDDVSDDHPLFAPEWLAVEGPIPEYVPSLVIHPLEEATWLLHTTVQRGVIEVVASQSEQLVDLFGHLLPDEEDLDDEPPQTHHRKDTENQP